MQMQTICVGARLPSGELLGVLLPNCSAVRCRERELRGSCRGSTACCTTQLLAHYEGICLCGDDIATLLKAPGLWRALTGSHSFCVVRADIGQRAKGDISQHPCTCQHDEMHHTHMLAHCLPALCCTLACWSYGMQYAVIDALNPAGCPGAGAALPGFDSFCTGYPGKIELPPSNTGSANPGHSNQHQTEQSERPVGFPTQPR